MTREAHPTPSQTGDKHISGIVKHTDTQSWEEMESLLRKFVYEEELVGEKYQRLFDAHTY
jgi:hypothetical protein